MRGREVEEMQGDVQETDYAVNVLMEHHNNHNRQDVEKMLHPSRVGALYTNSG